MIKRTVAIIGGHLAPALAVIEELKKQGNWNIIWIGRKFAMEGFTTAPLEYTVIPKLDIPFYVLETGRLQRKITKYTISSLFRVPGGILQAISFLKQTRPQVVLSFGGYLSFPIVIAAWVLGIPVVVHEQTTTAGLANKIASYFAKSIAISFELSRREFSGKKTVLTGNPVRTSILNIINKANLKKPLLYVTGGNQGSQVLNTVIENLLPQLNKKFSRIVHQVGSIDYPRFQNKKTSSYIPVSNIDPDEVAQLYKDATLVISRSGANTVCELAWAGVPAILIPLPWAAGKEQKKNAIILASTGLAKVIDQADLNSQNLLSSIQEMLVNPPTPAIRAKAKELVVPDAAKRIVNLLEQASS